MNPRRAVALILVCAAQLCHAQDIMPLPEANEALQQLHGQYSLHLESSNFEVGVASARDILTVAQRAASPDPRTVARAKYNLALARWRSQDIGAALAFVDVLAEFEDVYGANAVELIQPLVMTAESGLIYEAVNGTRATIGSAQAKAVQHKRRARRIALRHFGRDSIPFLEYELRTARASFPNEALFRSIHSRTKKLGPEGALLHARAADEYGNMLMERQNMLGVIEVTEGAIEQLERAGVSARRLQRHLHGRLARAYEMRGDRDVATRHLLAYAQYSTDSSRAQAVFLSEYQYRRYEHRFPTAVPVRVSIDEEGFVTRAALMANDVLDSSATRMAITGAYAQRFAPRLDNGIPVADLNRITTVRIDDAVISRINRVRCESEDDRSALTRFLDWSCRETE
ncbi:MAG: hypothetical protein AAF229_02660 [Pseudomonadota bacterium]